MSDRNLDKIFHPRSVAVIGASERAGSVGRAVWTNLVSGGFAGPVYPVNPNHAELDGRACYASVAALPEPVDLAVICTPAATVPALVRECGRANIGGLIILTAGFRETGASGAALEDAIRGEAAKFDGMRIIGPNSLGVIVPGIRLNASFAAGMPAAGPVAFLSQSGALCSSVLDWSLGDHIGFSYFVSTGNMVDVTFADLIDYCAEKRDTKSVVLYVESIRDARPFMSAARAFTRTTPIIAYKAGRFPQSAQAAATHTGAMAADDEVYDVAFARAGIERVYDLSELFSCAELLARQRMPRGERLAIVTNAGGPGVMASDALLARRGTLATLSASTNNQLNRVLPSNWSNGNPIDIIGDAPPQRYADAMRIVLADENVDALLVILTPQVMSDPTRVAQALAVEYVKTGKPVLAAWMGGPSVAEGLRVLAEAGIPAYRTADEAVRAFVHLVSYRRNIVSLYETPRDLAVATAPGAARRQDCQRILQACGAAMSGPQAKSLLHSYGIPVATSRHAATADAAAQAAREIGLPVVVKVSSPDISHKTDVEGVALGLRSEQQVRSAFEHVTSAARRHVPTARIDGVTVEPMIVATHAHELILGIKRDPTFGAVVMVGAGGVTAEVMGDKALGIPPLNERHARHMLESLRVWPLLRGHRGAPPVDLDKLVAAVMSMSDLAVDGGQLLEFEVNPLLASPTGVIALDARGRLGAFEETDVAWRRPHLVISPYPAHLARTAELKDGSNVLLRPIRAEDEAMWVDMLRSCSPETIHRRFFSLVKDFTHEMATRFCVNDYDRELAMVAEVGEGAQRRLIGVGRLVADSEHRTAEYGVLVVDAWQHKGLGSLLTDTCLSIARGWGVQRVVAVTAGDNRAMLEIFRRRGFALKRDPTCGTVTTSVEIQGRA